MTTLCSSYVVTSGGGASTGTSDATTGITRSAVNRSNCSCVSHTSNMEFEFDDAFVVDPHTHDDHTDSFYVLEGEVEFTVGDDTVRLGPGTVVSVPPGARHGFRGVAGTARMLNFHAPDAGFADSIRG